MGKPSPALVTMCSNLILNDDILQQLMDKFLTDIKLGLGKATHSASIVKCFITYVQDLPTGLESGKFLALDLGGTNFRVLVITLAEKRFDMKSKVYAISQAIMTGTGTQLFDHIADCLINFCNEHSLNEQLPLGFTFSFPLMQKGLSKGICERWTKGFNCSGVVGEDVVKLLEEALKRRSVTHIDVAAVLNDTTGTLMSCAWKNKNTKIGLIIGTGTNSCYVEKTPNAEMFEGDKSKPYVIINTESGAFGDDGKLDFIRTEYDDVVDKQTVNPGRQLHEKMISGMYMGELVRLVIVKAIQSNILFGGKVTDKMNTKDAFPTSFVSDIESSHMPHICRTSRPGCNKLLEGQIGQKPGSYNTTKTILAELGYPNPTDQECEDVLYMCQCVSRRAGHMVSASMAVLLNKMDFTDVTIGIDGSVYRFHPGFHDLMTTTIKKFVKPNVKFQLMLSEDGSGRGAALVAAVAARSKK